MENLYSVLCKRFPEIRSAAFDDNFDLPYVLLNHLVRWLASLKREDLTEELIQRVTDLNDWCNDQPRGETNENDLYTAWHVAFLEKLFRHNTTRILLPYIISKEELMKNKDYLVRWSSNEEFESALKEYK